MVKCCVTSRLIVCFTCFASSGSVIIGHLLLRENRFQAVELNECIWQVITEFCKSIGADAKQRQGLIRLAKKNGERLGFLA